MSAQSFAFREKYSYLKSSIIPADDNFVIGDGYVGFIVPGGKRRMSKDSDERIIEEYFGNSPEKKKLLELLCELTQILDEVPYFEENSEVFPE